MLQYSVLRGVWQCNRTTKPLTEKKLEAALTEIGSKICQQAYQLKKDFPTNGPQKAMQEIEHF